MRAVSGALIAAVDYVVRAHLRLPAFYRAQLRRDGVPDVPIRLRNISRGGFMGDAAEPVAVGSEIRLIMPFGPDVVADVRWRDENRIGCEVDGAFTNAQLAFLFLLAGRYAIQSELRMLAVSILAIATIGFL